MTLIAFSEKLAREVLPNPFNEWLARARASVLGRRLARGVFWSTAGAVLSRGLALVASIFTARLLGKHVFGEYGMLQSTVLMFATFATFGMGLTATKHVAEYLHTDPARAGRIIGLSSLISWASGGAMALVVVVIAPWLAQHSLAAPELSGALRLAGICLLFTVVNEAQLGSLSGFEAFRRRSLLQFVGGVAAFPCILAGVYFWGLTGAVWGLAMSQGLQVLLNFFGLHKEASEAGVVITWRLSRKEFKVLWEFSLPTLLGAAVYVPAMWVANTMMVKMPNGYATMGVFSAAERWRTAIRFVPTLLGGVALPMLASLQGRANREKYYEILWTNVKISLLLALVAASPIVLFSRAIMASYGHGFAEGRWVLVVLCIVALNTSMSWIIGLALLSEGRVWTMFWLNLGWAAALLTFCWFLRPQGALGLALAYLAAESVRLLWMCGLMKWKSTH